MTSLAPLEHFIEYGWPQGREGSSLQSGGKSVFELRQFYSDEEEQLRQIKAIAFYLPQFHPIPENDEWWGAGFTEWRNVTRARPFYTGHIQPKQPEALGYYDLRLVDTIRAQADLARIHGIFGFCFYYYWFAGRRLLEKPLAILHENADIDISFCVCWANENWTRTWDGLEREVLIAQSGSEEDEARIIEDIAPLFNDKRYIKVAGLPLLLIYRPGSLRNPQKSISHWRDWCRKNGFGNIYICMVESFERVDPRKYGIDASVEFPPLLTPNQPINHHLDVADGFNGVVYSYPFSAETCAEQPSPSEWPRYRGIMPNWDNTARRMDRGFSFFGSTPHLFEKWLSALTKDTLQNDKIPEKLVFINAWNEWAEGAYLEPDLQHGYGYLNRVRKVVYREKYIAPLELKQLERNATPASSIAVICHLFHPDLAEAIADRFNACKISADFYISIRKGLTRSTRDRIEKLFPGAVFFEFPNRGRDVLPFLQIAKAIRDRQYTAICKLHSKKSSHRQDGERWRNSIFDDLLGTPQIVRSALEAIRDGAGIVAPRNHVLLCKNYMGANRVRLEELASRMTSQNFLIDEVRFAAGTMFWCAPKALEPLLSIGLCPTDFEAENGQLDGTTAHAVERLIGLSCELAGCSIVENHSLGLNESESRSFEFALRTS